MTKRSANDTNAAALAWRRSAVSLLLPLHRDHHLQLSRERRASLAAFGAAAWQVLSRLPDTLQLPVSLRRALLSL